MFVEPRTFESTFILLTNLVTLCLGDVSLTCFPLTVPLGSSVTLYCSASPGGLDIKSSNNPDIPIFATAQVGYVASNQELRVEVIESSPSKLNVSITFNLTLHILGTTITCSSFRNDGQYEVCPITYPRPHLNPHAKVLCKSNEKNQDGCFLTSLSWNCSRNGLPLNKIEISFGSEEKVSVPGDTCTYNSTRNGTESFLNVTLIGHYITNDSTIVTTVIDLQSPYQISRNQSDDDGSTAFTFDVAQDQKTVLLLSLVRSDNLTIEREAIAPLLIKIPRTVNISYTIGTLLVTDKISVFYQEYGTYDQPCLECSHSTNASGTSTIQYQLIILILLACLTVLCLIVSSLV